MRSRFLIELTTPEVEKYFANGGKTAFLPVGCVEMHGPHQPIGTDTFVAKAFSLKAAEEVDGIVLPELHYSWSGATDGFAGTVSIGTDLAMNTVETIADKCYKMGFKRLIIISIHAPNNYVLYLSVRRIFEKTHTPALFVNVYRPFCKEADDIFPGEYHKAKEASLAIASLHILGKPRLYSEDELKYEDEEPAYPESYYELQKIGQVGYYMQDLRQHACPSGLYSLERGLKFLEIQAGHMPTVVKALDEYAEDTSKQWNQGWWRSDA